MKTYTTIIISILFISTCFAQKDLLPAFPKEINYVGDIAYFNGSPFTGLVVDEKTNKRLGEYRNGYKNGIFTEYYANGNKKTEGKYENGVKVGIHTEWFLNRQIKSSYTYNNGNILDGIYVTYLENGLKDTETTYKNGQIIISGKYEDSKFIVVLELSAELNSNGQKESEGYLKNRKKDGLWTSWYEGGQKKSEGYYKDGNQEGQWVSWFEDGKKEFEGNYKNGMKDGQGILYNYKEGITYNGEWKNDKREGQGILHNNINGVTYSGGWKNDLVEGYVTITLADGSTNYQGEFKNGKPDGQGITYEKGKKVYDGEWKEGKKNGKGTYNYVTKNSTTIYCIGVFLNDEFDGQGTKAMKQPDGTTSTFTGQFKNWAYFNGILYITYPNGQKNAIEYKDGIEGKTRIFY